jgi:hypothetical protein
MSEKHSPIQRWRGSLLRMLAVLALSLLLHALALHWAGGHIGLPSLAQDDAPPVAVALLPPPAPVAAAPEPPPPPPKPRPRPKPRPKAVAPQQASAPPPVTPPAESTAEPALADAAPAPSPAPAESTEATASAEAPPQAAPVPPPVPAPAAPEPESVPRYQVRMPPSVDMKYDVRALRQGKEVYGNGRIVWHADGRHYRIDGEAGVLFFTVLRFQSQGGFDDFGVAPQSYVEKRMRKDETVTRFEPSPGSIRFSSSTASYPRNGGEQDRASIVWQLASIGLGDPAQYAPGAQLRIFVAGVRDAEPWLIRVIGQEWIDTPAGAMQAWHVSRVPLPGSRDQKLDIWLAPGHSWYPVRLRFTEPSGEYLELAVSALQPAPPI